MAFQKSPHIVCFAPYTDWSIHSTREVTILHALRLRGCSVSYVTCDGAFTDCDLLQESKGAPKSKPANACLICQANVATKLAAWGMPYRWLGRWARPDDVKIAGQWVHGLKPEDYDTATYKDWHVGAWVRSSVHTHLRVGEPDLNAPHHRAVFGSYLYSGLLACFALDRLFEEEKPDAQLLFNGRMGPTRIALELAQRRGIHTICEERAVVPGYVMLYDNANCMSIDDAIALWKQWRDEPLTHTEIETTATFLGDRWRGKAMDVAVFSPSMAGTDAIKDLGLSSERPIWALFTSSIDESADVAGADGRFPSQEAWIDATVAYAARHHEIQLVIRVHPNVGSAKSLGRSDHDLAYYARLATRLPANVVLVPSDAKLSSYALAAVADVGLVWYSTIGIEMAAMGKRVLRAAGYLLGMCHFMPEVESPETYDSFLAREGRAATPGEALSIATAAWRLVYLLFYRRPLPFKQVRQTKWYAGDMAYQSLDELLPGRDPVLDRICEAFMSGAPLHPQGLAARTAPDIGGNETARIKDHLSKLGVA